MKLAILSDLHLEFWKKPKQLLDWIDVQDADLMIMAGDLHPSIDTRTEAIKYLRSRIKINILFIEGNHDYYRGVFPNPLPCSFHTQDGVRFAMATLWTHIKDENIRFLPMMNDFRMIDGCNATNWNNAHKAAWDSLCEADCDVIITHHAPSYRSVAPKYAGDSCNPFFVTHLEDGILEHFKRTKLWVHGHMHDPFDYQIRDIRVICNPHGYPREHPNPQVQFVEI